MVHEQLDVLVRPILPVWRIELDPDAAIGFCAL